MGMQMAVVTKQAMAYHFNKNITASATLESFNYNNVEQKLNIAN